MRKKALAALLFATTSLCQSSAVLAENDTPSAISLQSTISAFAADRQVRSEFRAYQLLSFARVYQRGVQESLALDYLNPKRTSLIAFGDDRQGQRNIMVWAARASSKKSRIPRPETEGRSATDQVVCFALDEAVKLLDKSSDSSLSLPMYFVASELYEQCGETVAADRCGKRLMDYIERCERKKLLVDAKELKTAAGLLTLMAGGAPKERPHGNLDSLFPSPVIAEDEFAKLEKLRLRAASLLDRLPYWHHERRMAHRDLVFFYLNQEKTELADQQKQILFNLVGVSDDRILYPSGFCGPAVWWTVNSSPISGACGTG